MNLSTVRLIYDPIGKAKFNGLMRNAQVYKRTPKSIAKATVDKVAKLIKTNRKVTREYLLKHMDISKTTTEAAVRVIFESGMIRKEKNRMLPNNPVVYVWNNENEKLQANS